MADPTSPETPGALAQLRLATRTTHEALDRALPDGLRSFGDYVRYLHGMLALAQWLADAWRPAWPQRLAAWRDDERGARLRADLLSLGQAPCPPRPAPAATPAEWLGGCYVMEGSALGARLLVRDLDHLARERPAVAAARRFLDRHAADPRRWPRLRTELDLLAPADIAPAVRGAERGFALVHSQFTAMEACA